MQENPNPTIDAFSGPYLFLSNFYLCQVQLEGKDYPSVEHAFQAAKTTDEAARVNIRNAETPSKAKKLGRAVKLRPDWESIKLEIMAKLLDQKFSPGSDLARSLLATGEQPLVEGNWWHDYYWGVCGGMGMNRLGLLLMARRKHLQQLLKEGK